MSVQVTEAMVNQFNANVFHLSQQKGSRLKATVRSDSQKSESDFYDRIGSVVAKEKAGRHSDVEYSDTPHSRRKVTMKDFYYADLVDKEDKLRLIQDPESEYSKAAYMTLGRKIDQIVIEGLLGTAYSGKEGATSVVLPNAQRVAAFDGTATTGRKLNLKTLKAIKKIFTKGEALDSDTDLIYLTVTSEQIESLMDNTEVTSSDYNSVKALVAGAIDTFYGFKFIRIESMPLSNADFFGTRAATIAYNKDTGVVGSGSQTLTLANCKSLVAWVPTAAMLGIGEDIKGRIDEIPAKHYAKQIYASMTMGCARLEEAKVVEVMCLES
jgi:hypothetical protein